MVFASLDRLGAKGLIVVALVTCAVQNRIPVLPHCVETKCIRGHFYLITQSAKRTFAGKLQNLVN